MPEAQSPSQALRAHVRTAAAKWLSEQISQASSPHSDFYLIPSDYLKPESVPSQGGAASGAGEAPITVPLLAEEDTRHSDAFFFMIKPGSPTAPIEDSLILWGDAAALNEAISNPVAGVKEIPLYDLLSDVIGFDLRVVSGAAKRRRTLTQRIMHATADSAARANILFDGNSYDATMIPQPRPATMLTLDTTLPVLVRSAIVINYAIELLLAIADMDLAGKRVQLLNQDLFRPIQSNCLSSLNIAPAALQTITDEGRSSQEWLTQRNQTQKQNLLWVFNTLTTLLEQSFPERASLPQAAPLRIINALLDNLQKWHSELAKTEAPQILYILLIRELINQAQPIITMAQAEAEIQSHPEHSGLIEIFNLRHKVTKTVLPDLLSVWQSSSQAASSSVDLRRQQKALSQQLTAYQLGQGILKELSQLDPTKLLRQPMQKALVNIHPMILSYLENRRQTTISDLIHLLGQALAPMPSSYTYGELWRYYPRIIEHYQSLKHSTELSNTGCGCLTFLFTSKGTQTDTPKEAAFTCLQRVRASIRNYQPSALILPGPADRRVDLALVDTLFNHLAPLHRQGLTELPEPAQSERLNEYHLIINCLGPEICRCIEHRRIHGTTGEGPYSHHDEGGAAAAAPPTEPRGTQTSDTLYEVPLTPRATP